MQEPTHTFSVLTLGCKVNQYESQALRERLVRAGWRPTRSDPGLVIINTCAVTARAEAKARKLLRRTLKDQPRARLVLTGCGLRYSRLTGSGLEELIPPDRRPDSFLPPAREELFGVTSLSGHHRPLVKVQDGCDAFCSYCVIPLLRGRPISRPASAVLEEVSTLTAAGYREIVLTGVNLGRYRDGGFDLAGLVGRVCELPGEFRIRLSSVEPGEGVAALAGLLAGRRLCPHLHLPLQSGSDRILRKMNRNYTLDDYRELVSDLRARRPDLAISTDCLVGFPEEEESDFLRTCRAVEEIGFSRVHIFPYSRRPLTRAAGAPTPPPPVVRERAAILADIAARAARRYREGFVGREVEVLAEETGPAGRTRGLEGHYLRAVLDGPGLPPGRLYRGRVAGLLDEALRVEKPEEVPPSVGSD